MKNTEYNPVLKVDNNEVKEGSSLNGKKLNFAVTAGTLFVQGAGQFGPTLSTQTTGTKVISMTIEEPWVVVHLKGEQGKTFKTAIPITSFTHTVLE